MALKPGKLPSKVVTGAYKFTGTSPATIGTLIGSGTSGISLDGTAALKVQMGEPVGIARDKAGNLYMVDWDNAVVWKMTAATSTMSIVAGTPLGLYSQRKFTGEGGLATNATLYYPYYVAVDPNGNLFISDYGAGRVLKVDAKTGILTTAAGGNTNVQSPGYGDGGPATQANVPQPFGIAFDSRGNLFIADGGPARIRRVDAKTGIITSVAGSATATSLGDGGPATAAKLSYPYSLAFDSAGDYWIGDIGNELVRRVDAKTGIITTVAGTGGSGETGDGGPALKAAIVPYDLAVDNAGAVYVSTGGNTIRKFTSGGNIDTVVGMGYNGFRGDGGPARMAELYSPAGVLFDASGNLLFADCGNYRVRKVTFAKP
jgi:sugar lactone lactonase YvrE